MAIENTYRDSEEILKVEYLFEKTPYKFKNLIITFQAKVLERLIEEKLIEPFCDYAFGSARGRYPVYKLLDDPNTLFYISQIGAPIAVGNLEEIVYAFDIENIILYGTCGVLKKELTVGKIIVPSKAYRDEGTSYHYVPASDFIDIRNYQKIEQILKDTNIDFVTGYTWTTDAIFRETKAIYEERISQGCIAVEMEVAAVEAFAQYRKLNFYPFIYGADELKVDGWDRRVLGDHQTLSRLPYFLVAKLIASKL
ncbi:nucleoside phosphorylase [Acholeplasma hippikon]|uniref:Uridine phosphorylase n=1 Tax=Acholeplasma hippikon TaxID=264636 RepID=A0A449BK86_9MOLU|nr:nucleoside phosphorylase [Acholeplasma hippikon]VEU82852.1 Purine nucleoside phosphorylase deoD-type [Acholeplasma hippikon]